MSYWSNITLTVLIHNFKTTWLPTVSMPFLSSSTICFKIHLFFFFQISAANFEAVPRKHANFKLGVQYSLKGIKPEWQGLCNLYLHICMYFLIKSSKSSSCPTQPIQFLMYLQINLYVMVNNILHWLTPSYTTPCSMLYSIRMKTDIINFNLNNFGL